MKTLLRSPGFTLLEVVIMVGILGILALLVSLSLQNLVEGVSLNTITQTVFSSIQLARSKTLASHNDTVYGIHFDTNQYVIFEGSTYSSGAATNEVYSLSSDYEFFNIDLSGGSTVVFERITGAADKPGTVGIRSKTQPTNQRTIHILATGDTGLQDTETVSNSRVTDSRHLHFALPWSIQTGTTLRLQFSSTQHDVTMANYFNGDKTEFDWEDTVTISGNTETYRIHTHALDAVSTLLCIHRDRRDDNVGVTISIDGKTIVSYTAGGAATVGAYGGTMTTQ